MNPENDTPKYENCSRIIREFLKDYSRSPTRTTVRYATLFYTTIAQCMHTPPLPPFIDRLVCQLGLGNRRMCKGHP